jgi:integrase
VAIWKLDDRRGRNTPRPWLLRWKVAGEVRSKTFPTQAAGDHFRSRLMVALGNGERFDAESGLPMSWLESDLTVADWAGQWFAEQRATWQPRTRRGAAEALARGLPLLVSRRAPKAPENIRQEVTTWLSGRATQPAFLERWSLPLSSVTPAVAEAAQSALGVGAEGNLLGSAVTGRYRKTMRALFAAAVARRLVDEQPWPEAPKGRAATRVTGRRITRRMLPNPTQVKAALEAVPSRKDSSYGYRVLLSVIYYAGCRPSEALALRAEDCDLPESGWGTLHITQTMRDAGELWTDVGEEEGEPKAGSVRDVPIPPVLVDELSRWLAGRRTGLVVATKTGRAVTHSNLTRAWARGRGNNPWRIYDLRHAAATLMLDANVPIGEVARRLGHSVDMLLRVYAGVLSGSVEVANERIEAALGQ